MSVVGNNRVGIPIVLLHDAEGAVVSVETKNGEIIRGLLFEAEDMMNLYIKNCVVWNYNAIGKKKRKVDQLYLRGKEIVYIVIPKMLQHAPMFQRIKHWRKHGGAPPEGVGAAVGQAAAILRKANERRKGGNFGGGRGRGGSGGRGGFSSRTNTSNHHHNNNNHFGGSTNNNNNNNNFHNRGGGGGSTGIPGQYGPR